MEVLVLQAFVSLMLVAGSLILFGVLARQKNHEHADRLALAPLDDDDGKRKPEAGATKDAANEA